MGESLVAAGSRRTQKGWSVMYSHSPMDKVAIFIDGENIHYSAKHLNMRLDYLKLCRILAGERRLVRAYFYTAISNQSEGKIDFINFLKLEWFHRGDQRG